jgi:hypothetical protein
VSVFLDLLFVKDGCLSGVFVNYFFYFKLIFFLMFLNYTTIKNNF